MCRKPPATKNGQKCYDAEILCTKTQPCLTRSGTRSAQRFSREWKWTRAWCFYLLRIRLASKTNPIAICCRSASRRECHSARNCTARLLVIVSLTACWALLLLSTLLESVKVCSSGILKLQRLKLIRRSRMAGKTLYTKLSRSALTKAFQWTQMACSFP